MHKPLIRLHRKLVDWVFGLGVVYSLGMEKLYEESFNVLNGEDLVYKGIEALVLLECISEHF